MTAEILDLPQETQHCKCISDRPV